MLTLLQAATGSDTLALLFPWRISAALVPIATTIVLSRLVAIGEKRTNGAIAWGACALTIALCVSGGVAIMINRLGFYLSDEEVPLLDFVRETREPGDVYFIPVQVPKLSTSTRGSLSSDFKPIADKRQDQRASFPTTCSAFA